MLRARVKEVVSVDNSILAKKTAHWTSACSSADSPCPLCERFLLGLSACALLVEAPILCPSPSLVGWLGGNFDGKSDADLTCQFFSFDG